MRLTIDFLKKWCIIKTVAKIPAGRVWRTFARAGKEVILLDAYVATIQEELNCDTMFTIGGVGIHESVVATFGISVILLIFGLIITSGLKVENPSRRQLAVEAAVLGIQGLYVKTLGHKGKRYVPYMMTIACYIALANLANLFGVKPPTKDITVTAALAVMSIILVQISGIQQKGVKGWLHSFMEPMPVMLPMNILELFIKPVSLCMRLFGNVLGAFIIMKLIEGLIAVVIPVPFSLYFDIFDGLIQVYVFTLLTSMYIAEAIE